MSETAAVLVLSPQSVLLTEPRRRIPYIAFGTFLFPLGICILSVVNVSVGPLIFGAILLLLACLAAKALSLAIPVKTPLTQATAAAMSVCLTVAGLTQMYALWYSGQIQNTTDAIEVFYPASRVGLAEGAFAPTGTNSDGSIWIWQFLYHWSQQAGFGDGPWVGVCFNCFLISISVAFILAAAQLIDCSGGRSRDISYWCIYAPFFWLPAAIHLRDAYAVLCSAAVLFVCCNLIFKPSAPRFILSSAAMLVIAGLSFFIRPEGAFMLGAIAFGGLVCAVLFGVWKQPSGRTISLGVLGVLGLISLSWFLTGRTLFESRAGELLDDNLINASGNSLGSEWIIRAILPVRLLVGTYYMFVHPVPLWANMGSTEEYFWLLGLNGLAMLSIAPFVVDGLWTSERKKARKAIKLFAAGGAIIGIASIVLSSMEPRHVIQFAPFLLVVAVFSPPESFQERRKAIWRLWFASILAAHLLWLFLKGGL